MDIIDYENEAESFYRDKYGISIAEMPFTLRKSLENLYFRGARMPVATLYSKLADCGIRLRPGVLLRTRMYSLSRRIPPEPPVLNLSGARAWHKLQQNPFTEEEISFMVRNFPAQVRTIYPSLLEAGCETTPQTQTPESPPGQGKQG